MSQELLLYGVFRSLIEHQVPLSVSDYLDAVRALDMQVRADDIATVLTRRSVRRLCEVLWTRSPEEVRLLHRIFDGIAPPTADEVAAIDARFSPATSSASTAAPSHGRSAAGADSSSAAGPVSTAAASPSPSGSRSPSGEVAVTVSFESAGQTGGVPLPRPVLPPADDAAWVLQPQTVMSARALAILWRRYRRMTRVGPRAEFDLDATVAAYVRRGLLDRPVMRARRTNSARLLILADASASMAPWHPFLAALAESLRLSRLRFCDLYYFANVPRRTLFATPLLTGELPAREVMTSFQGAGLLIVSDAGAARGVRNRMRVRQTRDFIAAMAQQMRAVVWVNPMPPGRWTGTTAEAVAGMAGVTTFPLDPASMIRAVDVLRGTRTS